MGSVCADLHVADDYRVIAVMPFGTRHVLYGSSVRRVLIAALPIMLAACSGSPSNSAADNLAPRGATGTATITGRVIVAGVRPPDEVIRFDADPQCAAQTKGEIPREEAVLIGEGNGLQQVFVYVTQGLPPGPYSPPATAVVLDQQKCRYVPRVLGVQVGQALTIRNSDPLLHTVRADAATNARFNVATPLKGFEVTRTFGAAEVMVPIKCDMHPWMRAYVGVLDHPFFAVTNSSGRFSVAGLPPGTFTLTAWHERLGTVTQEIAVQPNESHTLDFVFGTAQ